MLTPEQLRERLSAAAGRGFAAYRSLAGAYDFGHFLFVIDHVQREPEAAPTRARLRVDQRVARFPRRFSASKDARVATADWLARQALAVIARRAAHAISVDAGGRYILERTAAVVNLDFLELRLNLGLPTDGRLVLAEDASKLFFSDIPALAREALLLGGAASESLRRHVACYEDQCALRSALSERGLIAFLADGTVVQRRSEQADAPPSSDLVVPIRAPRELRVTMPLGEGEVHGLGIPRGVTVITGGWGQGKSTLLRALAACVHNQVPGDGLELAVSDPTTVAVVPEPGRRVMGLDLRLVFRSLPGGMPVAEYSAERVTAEVSQAANMVEAIEAGARVLLLDEDDCVPALMARDAHVRRHVPAAKDPVSAVTEIARQLFEREGISTVVATSSWGEFIEAADTVIVMDGYRTRCGAPAAKRSGSEVRAEAVREPWRGLTAPRVPQPESVPAPRGRKHARVSSQGLARLSMGGQDVDVSRLEGFVDESQVRAVGEAIEFARRSGFIDGQRSIGDIADLVLEHVATFGLDGISPHVGKHPGDYAGFRAQELSAVMNRLPGLLVAHGAAEPAPQQADGGDIAPEAGATSKRPRRRRRKPEAAATEAAGRPVVVQPQSAPEKPPTRRLPRRKAQALPSADALPADQPAATEPATEQEPAARRPRRRRRRPRSAPTAPASD